MFRGRENPMGTLMCQATAERLQIRAAAYTLYTLDYPTSTLTNCKETYLLIPAS